MRRRVLLAAMILLFALAGAAVAAPTSTSLGHVCSDDVGVGDYSAASYDGATTCVEAGALIDNVTRHGEARPRSTGRTPHGRWRCVTVRRREVHGDTATTHRTTCTLSDSRYAARVRFFALVL